MKNNDNESLKNKKEFTATDVKRICEGVDERNGFGIEFAIKLYRSRMKNGINSLAEDK